MSKKKYNSIITALAMTFVITPNIAMAAESCSTAPKSRFQDRAKLDDILKPQGLMINKINEENGCYKVVAVTRQFKTVTLFFNAETLHPVSAPPAKKGGKIESVL